MKKVNYILAASLVQQPEFITSLAQALEACPSFGTFLADSQTPNPTFEEVQDKVNRYWSKPREVIEFNFSLGCDLIWKCHIKYQHSIYYASEADRAAQNYRYTESADADHTIADTRIDSATLDWN